MMFLLQTPTPIPPPIAQLSQDVTQTLQGLKSSQDFFLQAGAIGILAMLSLALVVYLVFWRNRGGEVGKALATMSKLSERQDERIEALEKEVTQNSEVRENKTIEALTAVADAMNRSADIAVEIKALATVMNTRDMRQESRMITMEKNITKVAVEGSEPVQTIVRRVEEILKNTTDILSAVSRIESSKTSETSQLDASLTEIRLATSALVGAAESLTRKKTDSQPLPMVVANSGATPA